MKKNLLISLSVMIFLTVIVGYTAYNLTNSWKTYSEEISKTIATVILWNEISSSIDSVAIRANLYTINDSSKLKNEINFLHNKIETDFKAIQILIHDNSTDNLNLEFIKIFYEEKVISLINKIISLQSSSEKPLNPEIMNLKATLIKNSSEVVQQIGLLKTDQFNLYQRNENDFKTNASTTTIYITFVCVLLGLILMTISTNHISTLYERIEKQAKKDQLISKMTTAVCSTLELQKIFDIATKEIVNIINASFCLILEYETSETLIVVNDFFSDKYNGHNNQLSHLLKEDSSLTKILSECKQTTLAKLYNDIPVSLNINSVNDRTNKNMFDIMAVPIKIHNNNIFGFVIIAKERPGITFDSTTLELLNELSNQLSIAISNAQLYLNAKIKTEESFQLTKQLEKKLDEIKEINMDLIKSNELNIRIQEAERLRIAQDLHDEIIQGLIALIRISEGDSKDISKINSELKTIISQIRRICQNLRPSILDDLGLHSAVEWFIDDLEKFGIVAHLDVSGEITEKLPENVELTIFRVIQELCNNIKKHSKASNAFINIVYKEEGINLQLSDDGEGFEFNINNLGKTLGLSGIIERVKSVCGSLEITSSLGSGTQVNMFIPFDMKCTRRIIEDSFK